RHGSCGWCRAVPHHDDRRAGDFHLTWPRHPVSALTGVRRRFAFRGVAGKLDRRKVERERDVPILPWRAAGCAGLRYRAASGAIVMSGRSPSLDFGLGETADLLRETVAGFAAAEIAPR